MYDPRTGKVSVTRDIHFDKIHSYDRKNLVPEEFADKEWHDEDDKEFENPTNISDVSEENSSPAEGILLPRRITEISDSVGDSASELSNLDDSPNDQLQRETEEWSHLQLNRGDEEENIQPQVTSKRSREERLADPTPGTRRSTRIQNNTPASANIMCPVPTLTRNTPKSHIHMVTVLANLAAGSDDSGPDEPLTLKEAMVSPYWKDFEKAMHVEFRSLLENNTWKYKEAPSG